MFHACARRTAHHLLICRETVKRRQRADMVYVKTPSGGEVFAVGSITFCGSLPWNNFNNNVSRLLRNVVKKFVGTTKSRKTLN